MQKAMVGKQVSKGLQILALGFGLAACSPSFEGTYNDPAQA